MLHTSTPNLESLSQSDGSVERPYNHGVVPLKNANRIQSDTLSDILSGTQFDSNLTTNLTTCLTPNLTHHAPQLNREDLT